MSNAQLVPVTLMVDPATVEKLIAQGLVAEPPKPQTPPPSSPPSSSVFDFFGMPPCPVEGKPRKASGTVPLFKVRYTSNRSGTTREYGVFWDGLNTKDGVTERRLGLRSLAKDGVLMKGYNRFNKGFFVPADECTAI